jgi:thiamine-monophosphate kinase
MAAASRCGLQLDESALPLTAGCTRAQALGDGEDYEILFSIQPARATELLTAWPLKFPNLALTRIGVLVEISAGDTLSGGWEHFSAS